MGATEHVFVEQLVARHSIEELIVKMNKRDGLQDTLYTHANQVHSAESEYYKSDVLSSKDVSSDNDDQVNPQAKIRFLLSNVKLIRPRVTTHATRKRLGAQKKGGATKQSVKFNL